MNTNSEFDAVVRDCPTIVDLNEPDIDRVVTRLVEALVTAGKLAAPLRENAIDAILSRERTSSTALAAGICLPHGYLDDVSGIVFAVGIHRDGIECGAADGQPSRLFFVVLNAKSSAVSHVRFLSALNRRLLTPGVRDGILLARTGEDVRRLLIGD